MGRNIKRAHTLIPCADAYIYTQTLYGYLTHVNLSAVYFFNKKGGRIPRAITTFFKNIFIEHISMKYER